MWGSPAVPSTRASPSETSSMVLVKRSPGARKASPLPLAVAASANILFIEKPNLASTRNDSSSVPAISRTALTIWTQVVPIIPPKVTYTIISTPTPAMARIAAASPSRPSSSLTRAPAPTIWAIR